MRGGLGLGLVACCAAAGGFGCGVRLEGDGPNPTNPDGGQTNPDGSGGTDASSDAVQLGPWGTPQLITGAATGAAEDDGSMASTTNELVFAIADPNANNTKDLYYMSRPPGGAWGAPSRLPFNVTGVSDETPRFSPDNLTLYFASARNGGLGGLDHYRVTRPAVGGTWGTPQLVPGVSTTGVDKWFMPCPQNNTYLTILGNDIGEGTLGNPPALSSALSSPDGTETGTFLTPDCLTTYFASTRSGTNQLYVSTRPSLGGAWTAPARVTDFQALGGAQEDPWLAADLRTFVFVSNVGGTKDLYISTR